MIVKMTLDHLTQELESGIRLVRIEQPMYDTSRIVVVADVFTPHSNRQKGGRWDDWEDDEPQEHPASREKDKEANSLVSSLRSVGLQVSSMEPSAFNEPLSRNYERRLDKADAVVTTPAYVKQVSRRYGPEKVILLVDELSPEYVRFPQLRKTSLPQTKKKRWEEQRRKEGQRLEMSEFEASLPRLISPVLDPTSYETLFGMSVEKEEKQKRHHYSRYEDESKTLLERAFAGHLDKENLQTLEQLLRAPLTDPALIKECVEIIDYFVGRGAEYAKRFSRKLSNIVEVVKPLNDLKKRVNYMIECMRGNLGGALSFEYKQQGLNHDLPHQLDTDNPFIQHIKAYQFDLFKEALKHILKIDYKSLMDITLPKIKSAEMRRIKEGFDHFFDPKNPKGFTAMFEYLERIKEAEPKTPEELLEYMGGRDAISRYTLAYPFVRDVSSWLSLYASLAAFFEENNWTKPAILPKEAETIQIEDGWHPFLKARKKVQNPTYLTVDQNVEVVEGANKAGKSVYMLQVPIIVVLAQAGLYVPAKSATISIQERIYTRLKRTGSIIDDQSAFGDEIQSTMDLMAQTKGHERYSLIALDEWITSTRPDNGEALLGALLEEEFVPNGYKAVITAHMPGLVEVANRNPHIQFSYFNFDPKAAEPYTFKKMQDARPGSSFDYGIEIAEQSGLPQHIIRSARQRLGKNKPPM